MDSETAKLILDLQRRVNQLERVRLPKQPASPAPCWTVMFQITEVTASYVANAQVIARPGGSSKVPGEDAYGIIEVHDESGGAFGTDTDIQLVDRIGWASWMTLTDESAAKWIIDRFLCGNYY